MNKLFFLFYPMLIVLLPAQLSAASLFVDFYGGISTPGISTKPKVQTRTSTSTSSTSFSKAAYSGFALGSNLGWLINDHIALVTGFSYMPLERSYSFTTDGATGDDFSTDKVEESFALSYINLGVRIFAAVGNFGKIYAGGGPLLTLGTKVTQKNTGQSSGGSFGSNNQTNSTTTYNLSEALALYGEFGLMVPMGNTLHFGIGIRYENASIEAVADQKLQVSGTDNTGATITNSPASTVGNSNDTTDANYPMVFIANTVVDNWNINLSVGFRL